VKGATLTRGKCGVFPIAGKGAMKSGKKLSPGILGGAEGVREGRKKIRSLSRRITKMEGGGWLREKFSGKFFFWPAVWMRAPGFRVQAERK